MTTPEENSADCFVCRKHRCEIVELCTRLRTVLQEK
jgi:hypothetical protein